MLANDVLHPILYRLAKIGLQRPLMSGLECFEVAKRRYYSLLDQILRFQHVPSVCRQATVCPSTQGGQAPLEQPLERRAVTTLDSIKEFGCHFGRQGAEGRVNVAPGWGHHFAAAVSRLPASKHNNVQDRKSVV